MSDLSNEIKRVFAANGWNWDSDKNAWKKNRTTKTHDEMYAELLVNLPVFEDNTRKEMIAAIAEASVEDIRANLVDLTDMQTRLNQWQSQYQALVSMRWSDFDDACWKDMYYTLDQRGEKIIVARVSPNSKELRILGKTDEEVCGSLIGIYVDEDHKMHRHAYIDNLLTRSIIAQCSIQTPGAGTPIEFINGTCLPASVANVLYSPLAMIEEKTHFEWKLVFNKSTAYYPTVKSYIKNSISAFLSMESKCIDSESIVDASNSKDIYTYNYIDISKYSEGPTNEFDTWAKYTFQNADQYHCFMAWVGSIFDAENNSKQLCYLHGEGNMGTSKIQGALTYALGKYAVVSFSSPGALEGQFVNSSVMGKRLALIADVKNINIVRTGVVHNWTGGDNIQINEKHKQSFTVKKYMKIMDCENQPPAINFEEDNQISRILYFRLKSRTLEDKIALGIATKDNNGKAIEQGDNTFQDRLNSQVHHWIYKCIRKYEKSCPNRSQIRPYDGHLEALISNCADQKSLYLYNWLLDNYNTDTSGKVLVNDILDRLCEGNSPFNRYDGFTVPKLNAMLSKYLHCTYSEDDRKKYVVGISLKQQSNLPSSYKLASNQPSANDIYSSFKEMGEL